MRAEKHGADWSGSLPGEPASCRCGYNGTPEECAQSRTPTPVPSEVAETTAGEREVEALAKVIGAEVWRIHGPESTDEDSAAMDGEDIARAVLASDWLAALLDRVRREEGEKVLREAAERLPALTEGSDRAGTATWRPSDRDVYSLAIEEAQAVLNARAASVGPTD